MAKYLNLVNTIFVTFLFFTFCYFLIHGTYYYYKEQSINYLCEDFYALLILVWIGLIMRINNRIELKLYKEEGTTFAEREQKFISFPQR